MQIWIVGAVVSIMLFALLAGLLIDALLARHTSARTTETGATGSQGPRTNPLSPRRWYRFHLWQLLVFVAALSVVFGLLAGRVREWNERRAAAALRDLGGNVRWSGTSALVDFSGGNLSNKDLAMVVSHLTTFREIEELMLCENEITDLGLSHLKRLTNLQKLLLCEPRVTIDGVDDLRRHLPELVINLAPENEDAFYVRDARLEALSLDDARTHARGEHGPMLAGHAIADGAHTVIAWRYFYDHPKAVDEEKYRMLTIQLDSPAPGKVFMLPSSEARGFYSEASSTWAIGSYANDLRGTIRIDESPNDEPASVRSTCR